MKTEEIINVLQNLFNNKCEFHKECYFIHRELERKIKSFSSKLSPELLEEFEDLLKTNEEYIKTQNRDVIDYIVDFYKSI